MRGGKKGRREGGRIRRRSGKSGQENSDIIDRRVRGFHLVSWFWSYFIYTAKKQLHGLTFVVYLRDGWQNVFKITFERVSVLIGTLKTYDPIRI